MAVSRVITKNTELQSTCNKDNGSWLSVAEEKWEALSPVSPVYNITGAPTLTGSGTMGNSHLHLALRHGIKNSEQIINTK